MVRTPLKSHLSPSACPRALKNYFFGRRALRPRLLWQMRLRSRLTFPPKLMACWRSSRSKRERTSSTQYHFIDWNGVRVFRLSADCFKIRQELDDASP
ncbi:MAG: hypothetical protein BJ554DRAFT_4350 [Olpidium bornovanus]|uniref:Uncharacterized protein n=1 Tax=Olpidium bornovanus TaxID=278681 RepID=A0A8H8DFA0_9FUNG|nr:MAG: hypothetical protein BJ554DRAFT_4350 [Olpidium bornovanus]